MPDVSCRPEAPSQRSMVFHANGIDNAPTSVRLSELFAAGKETLVIYSFMFPRDASDGRPGPDTGKTARLKLHEGPCPSCVALLDQLESGAGTGNLRRDKPSHRRTF